MKYKKRDNVSIVPFYFVEKYYFSSVDSSSVDGSASAVGSSELVGSSVASTTSSVFASTSVAATVSSVDAFPPLLERRVVICAVYCDRLIYLCSVRIASRSLFRLGRFVCLSDFGDSSRRAHDR